MFGAAVRVLCLASRGLTPKLMLGGAMALLLAVGIEGFPADRRNRRGSVPPVMGIS